jgi:hypothetical protein
MIRRLHFEEAQQSHFAINAARESGEIKDDNEFTSLAEEFSALLAQMSGPAGTMPDQVSALGFALAQSAAPQRARHEDQHHAEKQHDDTQREGDSVGADRDQSDQDKTLNMSGAGVGKVRDRQEEKRSENKTESNANCDSREQIVAQDNKDNRDLSSVEQDLKVDNTELISADDSLAIESDDSGALTEVVSDVAGSDDLKVVEYKPTEVAQTEQVVASLDGQDVGRIIKSDKEKKEGEEQGEDADLFAVTTQVQADRDLGTENVRKNPISGKDNSDTEGALNPQKSTTENVSLAQTSSQPGQNSVVSSQNTQQEDFRLNADGKRPSDSQKTVKSEDAKHEDMQFEGPNHNVDFQSSSKRGDEAIQSLMLRHTFETIRASVSDGSEAQRSRPQTQSVQGVGAASEAKSSQNEGASRAKPLTRPHMARMMERVESTLKEAARSRDGKTLSLRLEPVDLGKVKVDVSLRDGALHARISPENQQVMQGLREHAHELQGALRKLGLDVDSVSVSITADEFSGEMTSGQGSFDGSSFQQERNNMPQDRAQLADNTIGSKLAETFNAGGESRVSKALEMVDHWIA